MTMSGALVVVTGTTVEPVSRNETKIWLRVDEHATEEDSLIDSLIARARARIEDRTQRSFITKTFDYYPDAVPCDVLEIPKAPLVSVTAIRAFQSSENTDSGGTAMTTSDYYVDTAHEFGRVVPVSGATYPTATRTINPFVVRFTAGYSSGSSGVPDSAKTEIKELVARMYEHRGDEVELERELESVGAVPTELDLPDWG